MTIMNDDNPPNFDLNFQMTSHNFHNYLELKC